MNKWAWFHFYTHILLLPLLSSEECWPSVTLVWSPRRGRSLCLCLRLASAPGPPFIIKIFSMTQKYLTRNQPDCGPTISSLRSKLLTILDWFGRGNNLGFFLLNSHSFISQHSEFFQTIRGIKKSKFPSYYTLLTRNMIFWWSTQVNACEF